VIFFTHSENSAGIKHDLVEHLQSAAQMVFKIAICGATYIGLVEIVGFSLGR